MYSQPFIPHTHALFKQYAFTCTHHPILGKRQITGTQFGASSSSTIFPMINSPMYSQPPRPHPHAIGFSILGNQKKATAQFGASSSSSSSSTTQTQSSCKYDVFLSFRGEDTRNTFLGHLYSNLVQKGIETFLDDDGLGRGEEISDALLRVIEESKISIVVFSENYASSKWCLEELVKILQCKESKQQKVYPVFYKVDPSDVRYQKGSFGQALAHHEHILKHNSDKVKRWREALRKAANLCGLHFLDGSHESNFIDKIVDEISAQLLDRIYLSVAKYPVGIESRVEDVLKLLRFGENDVHMVGIWGTGGIGKTTIAKSVYNSIAHKFEGSCFLENVRETSDKEGLVKLQESLLSKILRVKDLKVTSVDEGITIIKGRLCHKKVLLILDDVNHLNQLDKLVGKSDWFGSGSRIIITTRDKHCLTAHDINEIYKVKELSRHEALELFNFHAFKENEQMDDYVELIDKVTRCAQGLPLALKVLGSDLRGRNVDQWKATLDGYKSRQIQEILKTSYHALEDLTKEIFLHIACFFKGKNKNYVIDILNGCNLSPEYGIEVLTEKALISISEENDILMHDLLEEMGKEIVHQESPTEPGERSRLWHYKDVYRVLVENTIMQNLKSIDLSHCDGLTKIRDLFRFPNLADFNLSYCKNLVEVEVGDVKNLVNLDLSYCKKLGKFELVGEMRSLKNLDLGWTGIKEFPSPSSSIGHLINLEKLILENCQELTNVSWSIFELQHLQYLDLSSCHNLVTFPTKTSSEFSANSNVDYAPLFVDLSQCKNLIEISEFPREIDRLDAAHCESLTRISKLSNILEGKEKSKMIPKMNFFCCFDLMRDYVAKMKMKKKMNLPDSSEVTALLYLFLSSSLSRQSEFQITFPAEGKIPEWFTYRLDYETLPPKDRSKTFRGLKLDIRFPENFKWENKLGGLAFCAQVDVFFVVHGPSFKLSTIYSNGVCIIQDQLKRKIYNRKHWMMPSETSRMVLLEDHVIGTRAGPENSGALCET